VGPGAHARGIAGSWLIATATALVLLGVSIAPFLTPWFVRFEQDRTNVAALTGYSRSELDVVAGRILSDLVLWTGDFSFDIERLGPPLNEADRAHMRDVRGVFTGFWILVLSGIVVLAVAFRRARSPEARAARWRAVRGGARGLAIAIAVVAAFAIFAFDAAFEVFHRLFFSPGSYTFDPRTDKLVQLFPEPFWSETAIAVGGVILGVAILTAWQAARRAGAAPPFSGATA
jgi:integral membrane protein (TIGR01906 family)